MYAPKLAWAVLEHQNQYALPQLIQEALDGNPQIRSMEASLRVADYDVTIARWQYVATPSIFSEKVKSDSNDSYYKDGARVTYIRLQQPLFTWGRITAGLSSAQAKQLMAVASLEEARQQIALNVTQAYVDWMSAELRKTVYEQSKNEHLRLEALIRRRIDAGASPQSDYWLVKSRLGQLLAELQTISAQQENALVKLSELIGRAIASSELNLEPLYDTKPLLRASSPRWVERVDSFSPQLMRLKAAAQVAHHELQRIQASLMPEVYARVEYQKGHSADVSRLGNSEKRVFFGFSASFGAGFSGYAILKSASEKEEAAIQDIESARRNVRQQVLSDYNSLDMFSKKILALQAAQNMTSETLLSGERQFLVGRKSWQDLMNSSRELTQAKLQVEDARTNIFLYGWRLAISAYPASEIVMPNFIFGTEQ